MSFLGAPIIVAALIWLKWFLDLFGKAILFLTIFLNENVTAAENELRCLGCFFGQYEFLANEKNLILIFFDILLKSRKKSQKYVLWQTQNT